VSPSDLDALAARASKAGFPSIADYAATLEDLLIEADREYLSHQSWRCEYPPHYYIAKRASDGHVGCPCGLDEFLKRIPVAREKAA